MPEPQNPFAQPMPPVPPGGARGSRVAWCLAGGVTLLLGILLLVGLQIHKRQLSDLELLRTTLRQTMVDLAAAQAGRRTNEATIAALREELAALHQAQALADQRSRSLEDEMRSQLESKDVTISQLQGRLTVTIVDRVLFDSGEATLKPDGAAVMQKLADLLTSHRQLKVHVIGHTDNVPIRASAQSRFASNWELSTERALAAVHFLVEKGGIEPQRLGAVGYGEFRPLADNATVEGRARNRRIEIMILPEEKLSAETAQPPTR